MPSNDLAALYPKAPQPASLKRPSVTKRIFESCILELFRLDTNLGVIVVVVVFSLTSFSKKQRNMNSALRIQ